MRRTRAQHLRQRSDLLQCQLTMIDAFEPIGGSQGGARGKLADELPMEQLSRQDAEQSHLVGFAVCATVPDYLIKASGGFGIEKCRWPAKSLRENNSAT